MHNIICAMIVPRQVACGTCVAHVHVFALNILCMRALANILKSWNRPTSFYGIAQQFYIVFGCCSCMAQHFYSSRLLTMVKQLVAKAASESGNPKKKQTLSGSPKLQKKPASRSGSSGWQTFNSARDLGRARAKVEQLLAGVRLTDDSPKATPNSQQPATPTQQRTTPFDEASPFVAPTLVDSPVLGTLGF